MKFKISESATVALDILHKNVEFNSAETEFNYEHPRNTFAVLVDGVRVGTLAVLHPSILSNIDKKCSIAFFEIKTEAFAKVAPARISYKAPSKFPTIEIDLTFNANLEELSFGEVVKISRESAGEILSDVKAQHICITLCI